MRLLTGNYFSVRGYNSYFRWIYGHPFVVGGLYPINRLSAGFAPVIKCVLHGVIQIRSLRLCEFCHVSPVGCGQAACLPGLSKTVGSLPTLALTYLLRSSVLGVWHAPHRCQPSVRCPTASAAAVP